MKNTQTGVANTRRRPSHAMRDEEKRSRDFDPCPYLEMDHLLIHEMEVLVLQVFGCFMENEGEFFCAFSPLQTKVHAIQMAVSILAKRNNTQAKILTDCKQLSQAPQSKQPPTHLDWRLYSLIVHLWLYLRDN